MSPLFSSKKNRALPARAAQDATDWRALPLRRSSHPFAAHLHYRQSVATHTGQSHRIAGRGRDRRRRGGPPSHPFWQCIPSESAIVPCIAARWPALANASASSRSQGSPRVRSAPQEGQSRSCPRRSSRLPQPNQAVLLDASSLASFPCGLPSLQQHGDALDQLLRRNGLVEEGESAG